MKINRIVRITFVVFALTALMACDMSSLPLGKKTPTPTATSIPTATPVPPTSTSTVTNTPLPTSTKRPTATVDAAATQQYEDMATLVKGLADKGYIASTDGKFYPLEDFSNEWAQLGWYQWALTKYSPTDFILRADLAWESASKNPNPSGCGIVFHVQPNNDHFIAFVSTDGYVYFAASIGNDFNILGGDGKRYGPEAYKGQATLVLIVTGVQFRTLINGKSIGVFSGYSGSLLDGNLGYTIVSGTNAGFGTRCNITNVALWQIKP
jgi:hypothetical protein